MLEWIKDILFLIHWNQVGTFFILMLLSKSQNCKYQYLSTAVLFNAS